MVFESPETQPDLSTPAARARYRIRAALKLIEEIRVAAESGARPQAIAARSRLESTFDEIEFAIYEHICERKIHEEDYSRAVHNERFISEQLANAEALARVTIAAARAQGVDFEAPNA
ncbi:MAG TPA: hypothetical protein VGM88_26980 [Kofleriaceae bacterium]|jgi:hypothetical protein